ncbi:NnrU family protein [Tepidimonas charontis]|uniref:NnrU protein n=1 Tax=Tepidimonas charontis TaxID=2267262 RepID=A0A554XFF4_9BURK|nr:NnrU family protein [Tepidimonas charontis]TSE34561.1 NnrU protein [Tepidimonas charontis]
MQWLVLGLIVFLGVHSVRIVADDWRTQTIDRWGLATWKAVYSLLSLAGLALIVVGYDLARQAPLTLWQPPLGMRHAASLLTLIAFVLLVAAYVPGNALKARLGHPMVLAVKLWAFAHLLANGTLADVLLFGGFLVWAIFNYRSARRRGAAPGPNRAPADDAAADGLGDEVATDGAPSTLAATVATVVVGVAAWALFAFWAHGALFGVRLFG